jgi:hypothetical protein
VGLGATVNDCTPEYSVKRLNASRFLHSWVWASGGKGQDAALVFYDFREPPGRLEMVVSGFSGRATRLLAKTLAARREEFWPPVYQEANIAIGAFIVKYESDADSVQSSDLLQTDVSAAAKIFPISGEAIRRRMERQQHGKAITRKCNIPTSPSVRIDLGAGEVWGARCLPH